MRSDLGNVQYASVAPIYDSKRPSWFEDESEWEYEYDENETEDLYFTLDLTTHLPDAPVRREAGRNGRRIRGTLEARKQKIATRPKQDRRTKAARDTVFIEQETATELLEENAPPEQAESHIDSTLDPLAKVQFVGLDTASPYITYNGNFYSAYWLSDNGTQLWLSDPGVTVSPIFKGYILDIVGMSQVRLVAKPASASSRDVQPRPRYAAAEVGAQEDTDNAERQSIGPITVPKNLRTDPGSHAHADFMERFSRLKWKLGQQDQVQTNAVRTYEYPSNAAEIRGQALAADENEDQLRQILENSGNGSMVTATEKRKARKAAKTIELSDGDDEDYEYEYEDGTPSSRGGAKRKSQFSDVAAKHVTRAKRLDVMGLRDPSELPPVRRRRTKAEMERARARGEK